MLKENNILSDKFPVVTIVMPVYNEAGFIEKSLDSVFGQDYSPDKMEVIIVDGLSSDGTRGIVNEAILNVKSINSQLVAFLLDNPSYIVSISLNLGLKQARGEVIIRVDGHCEIAPNYVTRCVEALQATGADCVGGLQKGVSEKLIGRAVALAMSSPFGAVDARYRYGKKAGWVDTVYLGAYRKDVFEKIGSFDEELVRNQDDEFNFRLIQAGGKIWFDPSIRSVYYSRSTLRGLRRQYFQYGFWKIRVIQKRRALPSWRQVIPSLLVLGIVGSLILGFLTHKLPLALGVIIPYSIINLGVSFWKARENWKTVFILPIVFFVIHFSYGIGFLVGCWHWSRKRSISLDKQK